jgi:signal transduction histidine kinase
MNTSEPDGLAAKIEDSKKLVAKAINDLRDIAKGLNSDNIADIGLVRAIEYELKMIEKTGSYKTSLELSGEIQKLPAQKELILFRIVQEILNNIIKHANGKSILINADYSTNDLKLLIKDDGEGFNTEILNIENTGQNGLGIRNMNSRAKLIGAEFTMNSTKGNGTEVKLSIPIQNNNLIEHATES